MYHVCIILFKYNKKNNVEALSGSSLGKYGGYKNLSLYHKSASSSQKAFRKNIDIYDAMQGRT
jgi:hypothetical protein